MNIYLRELNVNKKGLLIWSLILVSLVVMVMAMYPTMVKEADQYTQIIEGMSDSMRNVFNSVFAFNQLSLTDIFGFYAIYGTLFVTLMGSIYAVTLASGILSKEESDKTVEFILSKPISRSEMITGKLLAYVTNIFLFNVITSVALFISFEMVKTSDYNFTTFALICLAPFLLHLTFGALGFFVSVFITKSRTLFSVSLGIVFLSYFLGVISGIAKPLGFLKYFSPFKYVELADVINQGGIAGKYLLIMFAVNLVFIALTYVFYNKKDITV